MYGDLMLSITIKMAFSFIGGFLLGAVFGAMWGWNRCVEASQQGDEDR